MIVSQYIKILYDYHYWANQCVLNAALTLTEEQLHRPQGYSWGSVHSTLLHMMNTEWIWLQRWEGNFPETFPVREDYPTLGAICERWSELELDMRAVITGQSEEDLERVVPYTNTLGNRYSLPLWQMMVHIPNHGSHHRGELAAMLTLMGVSHQEEDLLHYFLKVNGQR